MEMDMEAPDVDELDLVLDEVNNHEADEAFRK